MDAYGLSDGRTDYLMPKDLVNSLVFTPVFPLSLSTDLVPLLLTNARKGRTNREGEGGGGEGERVQKRSRLSQLQSVPTALFAGFHFGPEHC